MSIKQHSYNLNQTLGKYTDKNDLDLIHSNNNRITSIMPNDISILSSKTSINKISMPLQIPNTLPFAASIFALLKNQEYPLTPIYNK